MKLTLCLKKCFAGDERKVRQRRVMVRSKIGSTNNLIAAEPLVFSVVLWSYMHLGFKSCHGVILKKNKEESEVRSSVGSS